MTALIADDEELARLLLKTMLTELSVEVIGEASTGLEAVTLCAELNPDVLFCDIRMPDMNGLETAAAVSQLDSQPLLVFVTGYSEHAAEAFERAAFDYILKPVQPDRLRLTVDRCGSKLLPKKPEKQFGPLKRLPIRTDYAIRLLKVEEIVCATTKQKRVHVQTDREEFKTNYTLSQLEQILPAETFMRIHASAIVKLDAVEEINFLGNHTYDVRLSNGVIAPVGRNQYGDLQRRLGI